MNPHLTQINALLASSYRDDDYPVCRWQTERWSATRPFEKLTVLDATPIFRNTLVKHRALLAAGARLLVGRAAGFPCDEKIVELLRTSGVEIVRPDEPPTCRVDVVLDCAASFIHLQPRIGAVELTRSGVPKYAACPTLPVFVADGGRIKKIETCLGTGESYFRAMRQLGYSDWSGKKIVIFGSGKVGFGLLACAVKMGAVATVVTRLSSLTHRVARLADRVIDCEEIETVAAAVADAYAVVTATGVAGALSHPRLAEALMHSSALLANMGVEDEFGPHLPASRVLMQKRTLNFILEEPTHLKYIDATMGLHNAGISYLLSHPTASGLVEPPADLEEELLQITRQRGKIADELNLI